MRFHPPIRKAVETGRAAVGFVEKRLDDRHEALGCLELRCMPYPLEHAEVEGLVAGGRGAGEGDAHENVLGTVDEQRRAGCGRDGEVGVEVAGDLLEQRPGRVGVGRRRLGVGVPFGGQEHEPLAQVRVEALGFVQGDTEAELDESFRPEDPGTGRDRAASERRHHDRHVPRGPHPRRRGDATPWQRWVDEYEGIDEVGAARSDAGPDHAAHRVAEDRRRTDLLQQAEREVAVCRDRGVSFRCACPTETDEVDGGHRRVETIREELPDRLPRQGAGAEPVDEDDLALGCWGFGCGRGPGDRMHADAVDLEVLRSAGVHPPRLGDGRLGIDPIPLHCTIERVLAPDVRDDPTGAGHDT